MDKEKVLSKIHKFGEFSKSEAEAIASAYFNSDSCYLEAVTDLASGWNITTYEAVKRIVEG